VDKTPAKVVKPKEKCLFCQKSVCSDKKAGETETKAIILRKKSTKPYKSRQILITSRHPTKKVGKTEDDVSETTDEIGETESE